MSRAGGARNGGGDDSAPRQGHEQAPRSHVHHARLSALVLRDLLRHHALPAVLVCLGDLRLQVHDRLRRVKALRAAVRAIHDAVATVELHGVVHPCEPLLCELVPGVRDPAVRLHQDRGAQVVLRVPPVRGARGHATRTQDALVHAVQLRAVLAALEVLLVALLLDVLPLQPGLDGLVLVVEVREVRHQVLHDVAMRQGLDLDGSRVRLDVLQAGQAVLAVDVHGARAADTLTARPPKGQCGVHLVLDLEQRVQDHWPASFEVDRVLLEEWLRHLVRVVAVDRELLRRGHRGGEGAAARQPLLRSENRPQASHGRGEHCSSAAGLCDSATAGGELRGGSTTWRLAA
mmetsp:Transcript_93368/g.269674  ORF Transcript_93368/g.269674 Transcript_93368/m.269674 type:complete len:346 (+) Transcript_93368:162-1199(+)